MIFAGLFVRTLQKAQAVQPALIAATLCWYPWTWDDEATLNRGAGCSTDKSSSASSNAWRKIASLSLTVPLSRAWRTGVHLEGVSSDKAEVRAIITL